MKRRNFLAGLGAMIGGIALDAAMPLGKVFSFPRDIKCVNSASYLAGQEAFYGSLVREFDRQFIEQQAVLDAMVKGWVSYNVLFTAQPRPPMAIKLVSAETEL